MWNRIKSDKKKGEIETDRGSANGSEIVSWGVWSMLRAGTKCVYYQFSRLTSEPLASIPPSPHLQMPYTFPIPIPI